MSDLSSDLFVLKFLMTNQTSPRGEISQDANPSKLSLTSIQEMREEEASLLSGGKKESDTALYGFLRSIVGRIEKLEGDMAKMTGGSDVQRVTQNASSINKTSPQIEINKQARPVSMFD